MANLAAVICAVVLCCCAAPPPKGAPEPVPADATPTVSTCSGEDRIKAWNADLEVFGTLYRDCFAGAFVYYPRAEFDADLAKLQARVADLSEFQIMYALKAMSARTKCGHAGVEPQRGALLERRMPYQLRAFDDGLFVIATDEPHADMLGARVLRIGGVDTSAALERAASLTPSESESWTRARAPEHFSKLPALEELGLAGQAGTVELHIKNRAGAERTVTLTELPAGKWPTVPLILADDQRAPISYRTRQAWYGSEWLDPAKTTLYVWYDKCSDQQGKTVSEFARETLARIDADKPRRVIIDLRRNGGGNSALLEPLVSGLAARSAVNRKDALIVLIGPGSFSSGAMNAEQLRRDTRATFIGEANGSRPMAWMEVRSIVLPNSLLRVNYMLRAPRWSENTPKSFEPDIAVRAKCEDLVSYRDPALESAQQLPFTGATP